MQSGYYCAYNLTRNRLLSEHVVSVSEPQTPEQLLAIVLNGPGRNPQSAVLLTGSSAAPEIARLFAFDIIYLGGDQSIIEAAGVGPGTSFPAFSERVRNVLFLPDQCVFISGTVRGDVVRICTETELAVLLRTASQPDPEALLARPISSSQLNDLFSATPHSVADEPFSASLIYLPQPRSPQGSELFLRFDPVRVPASSTEPAREEVYADDDTAHERQTISESPPFLPEIAELDSGRSLQPELQPTTPASSSLPPNLKAVIQFVDEQLSREERGAKAHKLSEDPYKDNEALTESLFEEFDDDYEEDSTELQTAPIPTDTEEMQSRASPVEVEPQPMGVHPTETGRVELPEATFLDEFQGQEITLPPAENVPPEPETPIPYEAEQKPHSAKAFSAAEAAEVAPVQAQDSTPTQTGKEPERPVLVHSNEKLSFTTRVQRWLSGESIALSGNRRRGERVSIPGLVAFYFTGGAAKPHDIVNISSSGLYLRSKELWSLNTLVRMTLERPIPERVEKQSISVLARVVRIDDGGIGHEFVTTETLQRLHARELLHEQGTDRKELGRFLTMH